MTIWAPSLAAEFDRILARRDGVDAPVERILRPRPDLDARLFVELAVTLDKPGLQGVDDHRRRLVEALARLVHAQAEGGELAARQTAPEAEPQPSPAQHVEHRGVLGDAQRVVPGQDNRGGAEIDIGAQRGQIGHQLQIVRHERIVVEVMLGRPQAVEAEIGGQPCQPDLLVPDAGIGTILPAVAGEDHHHADIHRTLLSRHSLGSLLIWSFRGAGAPEQALGREAGMRGDGQAVPDPIRNSHGDG